MKKRLIALVLAVCMMTFSSCIFNRKNNDPSSETKSSESLPTASVTTSDAPDTPTNETPVVPTDSEDSKISTPSFHKNEDLTYNSYDEVKARMEEEFAAINRYLEENDAAKAEEFQKICDDIEQDFYYFNDESSLAYVRFCSCTTDEEASENYEMLTELVNGYRDRLIGLYRPIYESAFKDTYYKDWTEEEIKHALMESDASGEEMLTIKNELDAVTKSYEELDQNSETYFEDSAKAYQQIVALNIQKAKKLGFDSYPEYSYKYEYGRDFTPADTQKMYDCVKNYILPLGNDVFNALVNYRNIQKLINDYNELNYTEVTAEDLETKLKPYYDKLGGKLPESFSRFKEYYTASNDEAGLSHAYTTYLYFHEHPYCFFGPDCQGLFTYVHEQGHFNAFMISGAGISSVDLCEVHSQGNEWLYLASIKDDYTSLHFKYLSYYHLYDSIITIMLATCCDAFEQYVYAHPELTADDYDDVFVQEATKMGVYEFLSNNLSIAPEDYWHYAIVSNSMYYISYAVSKVPSIEVFAVAKNEGFEQAVKQYKKLLDIEEDAEFVETITAAGFGSPFTEDPYKNISECFK